jgi:hypothetical protein
VHWDESEERVREAVAASDCWAAALRRLGLRAAGHNHRTLKKYVASWGIDTSHFDADAARRRRYDHRRLPLEEMLVENSRFHRGHLKQRLFDEGLKERQCEECGQGEMWRGRRMSLILDHINGVYDDNRLENLRIVCPNCAATLETHCGRKNRIENLTRSCGLCGKPFVVRYATQRYCGRECGIRAPRKRGPRPGLRKVERPPYEQLLEEIARFGYSATGRRYGVSDNAIRKWVRAYEREAAGQVSQETRAA